MEWKPPEILMNSSALNAFRDDLKCCRSFWECFDDHRRLLSAFTNKCVAVQRFEWNLLQFAAIKICNANICSAQPWTGSHYLFLFSLNTWLASAFQNICTTKQSTLLSAPKGTKVSQNLPEIPFLDVILFFCFHSIISQTSRCLCLNIIPYKRIALTA